MLLPLEWGCNIPAFECMYWHGVFCALKKHKGAYALYACEKCEHYVRWEKRMFEEDEEMMREMDEERKRLESGYYDKGGCWSKH